MRALLPDPVPDVDVHEHYARNWVDRGGLRANMIASVDGAVSADGRSGGLQTAGDNAVFAALRDLADVVLVGWSTADTEGYRPVRLDAERLERRTAYGLGPHLPTAVITRSLQIEPNAALLAGAAADTRTLVITCASSDETQRAALADVAEVLVCGDHDIDYAAVRRELAERNLVRVLCEGGPRILSAVAAAGELDELCLSLSPMLAGPGSGRIVGGDPWARAPIGLEMHGLLDEDGALFARYARR